MRQVLLVLSLLLLPFAHDVYAAPGVVMNELMVHPESGSDWVELYNNGPDADLSGWQLKDTGSTALKTFSGTLAANSYLVIEVTNRLNNSGDTLLLVNGAGTTIDSYSYASDPGINKTVGRSPNGTGNFGLLTESSKGAQNGSAQALPTSTPSFSASPNTSNQPIGGANTIQTGISLSEFLPAPNSGDDEWVEIYNSTDTEVYLGGWRIDDEDGGSTPFTIPAEGNSALVPPKSYKVYIMPAARLNNSGDMVRLLRPDGSVAEETAYTDAKAGIAFAKDSSGQWQQTSTPTVSADNIITPVQILNAESKSTQSSKPIGTKVASAKLSSPAPTTLAAATGYGPYAAFTGNSSTGGKKDHNFDLPILSLFASNSANRSVPQTSFVKKSYSDATIPYLMSSLAIGVVGVAFWFVKVHKRKEDVI